MAYIEVWKGATLVTRREVEEQKAGKSLRVRLGSKGQTHIRPGESKTVGSYRIEFVTDEAAAARADGSADGSVPTQALSQLQFSGASDSAQTPAAQAVPQIEGYTVLEELGHGGMGIVWRAIQLSTKRHVALKLLGVQSFASKKARARFEREVALSARLTHPNIARVYDSGLHSGIYYYAMELVEGTPLDRYVHRAGLNRTETLGLMKKACEAMAFAHSQGVVVHRDLKPSNILVTSDGEPHIVDFGLAKARESAAGDVTISIEGEIAGTPGYMSPEQAAGRTEAVDERSDVYSLGVILYHLLTARMPHDPHGSPFEVMKRKVEEEVIPPRQVEPSIDRDLESLLLKALAHEPTDRYRSCADLAEDIRRYLAGESLSARGRNTLYFLGKQLQPYRRYAVTLPVALIGIVVVMVVAKFFLAEFARLETEIRLRGNEDRRQVTQYYEQVAARHRVANDRRESEASVLYQELDRAVRADNWRMAAPPLQQLKNQYSDTTVFRTHRVQIEAWERQTPEYLRFGVPGGYDNMVPRGYQVPSRSGGR